MGFHYLRVHGTSIVDVRVRLGGILAPLLRAVMQDLATVQEQHGGSNR